MRKRRSHPIRAAFGVACVMVFAVYGFTFSGEAAIERQAVPMETALPMPTARDLVFFERRLRKASRESQFAKTCGRGQVMGSTEVHVAMHFPPYGRPATTEQPGFARAHIDKATGTPKALVLDSKYPTLWSVTGGPEVIVLLGEAVIADYPEGATIFAPRFSEACGQTAWTHPPRNWTFSEDQSAVSSLVEDMKGRFDNRAEFVAKRLFDRPAASWMALRGAEVMAF